MNWSQRFAVLGAAFAGGVATFAQAHFVSDQPFASVHAAMAFAAGCAVAGVTAVVFYYRPVPAVTSGDTTDKSGAADAQKANV